MLRSESDNCQNMSSAKSKPFLRDKLLKNNSVSSYCLNVFHTCWCSNRIRLILKREFLQDRIKLMLLLFDLFPPDLLPHECYLQAIVQSLSQVCSCLIQIPVRPVTSHWQITSIRATRCRLSQSAQWVMWLRSHLSDKDTAKYQPCLNKHDVLRSHCFLPFSIFSVPSSFTIKTSTFVMWFSCWV